MCIGMRAHDSISCITHTQNTHTHRHTNTEHNIMAASPSAEKQMRMAVISSSSSMCVCVCVTHSLALSGDPRGEYAVKCTLCWLQNANSLSLRHTGWASTCKQANRHKHTPYNNALHTPSARQTGWASTCKQIALRMTHGLYLQASRNHRHRHASVCIPFDALANPCGVSQTSTPFTSTPCTRLMRATRDGRLPASKDTGSACRYRCRQVRQVQSRKCLQYNSADAGVQGCAQWRLPGSQQADCGPVHCTIMCACQYCTWHDATMGAGEPWRLPGWLRVGYGPVPVGSVA